MPILALVRDLLFASKITATARSAGIEVKIIRDPAQLPNEGDRLFVDLNQPAALEAAIRWKDATAGEVVGFVSHVDSEKIRAARQAGIDRIMPRSRFDRLLSDLIKV